MTCADAAALLDAFVDGELAAPQLVAVARHVAACAACDGEVRGIEALHEAIKRTVREQAGGLDLSGLWPVVKRRLAGRDARRAWARRVRTFPVWGAALAMAAAAVFWLRPGVPEPRSVAVRPNRTVIERINSEGRFELRRERKLGTTLIMVSAVGPETSP